jgi:LysM repeat protein
LTYGHAGLNVFKSGRLLLLNGSSFEVPTVVNGAQAEAQVVEVPSEEMGRMHLGTPLTNRVQSITLQDEDVVLVLSGGLEEGLTPQQRLNEILRLNPTDPKALGKALINLKATTRNDRTLVVISGPYEHSAAKDAWKELETSVKSLAAQVSGLAENDQRREAHITLLQKDLNKETQIEQRISQRLEAFKAESQEKLKKLEAEFAGKAENAEVLALRKDMLQLRILVQEPDVGDSDPTTVPTTLAALESQPESSLADVPLETKQTKTEAPSPAVTEVGEGVEAAAVAEVDRNERSAPGWFRTYVFGTSGPLLLLAAGAGILIGIWAGSRMGSNNETWLVRTSGNQLQISRQYQGGTEESLSMKLAQPPSSQGEQRFATLTEVKYYLEEVKAEQAKSLDSPVTHPTSPATETAVEPSSTSTTTEAQIQQGDTLSTISARYKITQSRLRQLNPNIKRWTSILPGEKIIVPASTSVTKPASAPTAQSTSRSSVSGNSEVTVRPGDSLDKIAKRHNVTVAQLKELNPTIRNWLQLQIGQKIVVPPSP